MKKLFAGIVFSIALIFCGIGFVGCEENTLEIKDLSINTAPEVLTYYVGQDLQLTGGTIKVVYEDDSVKILPMTLATPNLTTFLEATNDQIITLTFKGKTTKFGVSVRKGELKPVVSYSEVSENGTYVVKDSYCVEDANFLNHLNPKSLPQNENISITCYYKDKGSADSSYTTQAPTNAGFYDVKLSFRDAKNYNDLDLYFGYEIYKANIKDLVLSGNTLDYNSVKLNQQASVYGTKASLSLFWTQEDGYLGEVPLPENVKLQLEYAYKKITDSSYTIIQPNVITKQHEITLPVGVYMVEISIHNSTNINDEILAEFRYVVVQKDLELGQDYNLYVSDGTNQVKIDENFAMNYDSSKTYSLVLVSNVGELTLNNGTTYYLGNSSSGATNITSAGQYTAEYSIVGNDNYRSTGRERISFTLG